MAIAALILALSLPIGVAQAPATEQEARRIFQRAKIHSQTSKTNMVAAWELARAAFDLAEVARDGDVRLEAAHAGVTAAREAISLAPNSAPAHYYLALNLGQSARGKRTGAFRILREMERALLTAAQLDCEFDCGGPDRSLGMLYLQAPPWPVSIGNRAKARAHLERAVQLDPGYPENRIALAEAFARWGETKALGRELGLIEELLPKVRARFGGALWEQSWQEWEDRFDKLQRRHEQLVASPRASPGERGAKPVK